MVDLTTLRSSSVDDSCILDHADFELLDHPTTVAYSRHKTGFATGLQQAIDSGFFTEITPVPAATLRKIIECGRRSPELTEAAKRMLPPP